MGSLADTCDEMIRAGLARTRDFTYPGRVCILGDGESVSNKYSRRRATLAKLTANDVDSSKNSGHAAQAGRLAGRASSISSIPVSGRRGCTLAETRSWFERSSRLTELPTLRRGFEYARRSFFADLGVWWSTPIPTSARSVEAMLPPCPSRIHNRPAPHCGPDAIK